jgi:hypothetical protein
MTTQTPRPYHTEPEFEAIMAAAPKRYEDYPNTFKSRPYVAARSAYRAIRRVAGRS